MSNDGRQDETRADAAGGAEHTSRGQGRGDALGELIRAAGRRPSPRAADYERVLAASRDAWRNKVRVHRRRRWIYALAAMFALVAIGSVVVISLAPRQPVATLAVLQGQVEVLDGANWQPLTTSEASIAAGTRLRTVAGGRAAFAMAQGASLRVDSATELAFATRTRVVLDAGTVYVDSGIGVRTTPLEIATAFGTIRDIGTQYEVRALSSNLRIRVREGLVELSSPGQAAEIESRAGEELTVAASGTMQRQTVAPDDPDWQWAEALAEALQIDGRSAYEVLRWIARETGRRLVFEDSAAELHARNAIVRGGGAGLTPDEALEVAIVTTEGLDYAFDEGVLIIRTR